MKLATWNVNSLNVRLGHVIDWLQANPVDALCLQELKLPDEKFPHQALEDIGYHACWAGQKTYNGVAIISKAAPQDVQRNIPGYDDPQQRIIAATLADAQGMPVRVISAYCPNGQAVGSDKYAYKLHWFEALQQWLADEIQRHPDLAILGDYNVAPTDADVHDPDAWAGNILVSDAERQAFQGLIDLGLTDTFRLFDQAPKIFSWWDYRQMSFRRNVGVRIDHILATPDLAGRCTECVVDKTPRGWEKPSDHAPVVARFELP
ncbi:exodeoxyribonuclease III [Castellaniella caeni]|uniref:exodeoxyribonuclease III n=1 Tax=Castellaniella caeni TaxID=266123 RepID=UPI000830D2ED|nr:exodeoxyribonuclease III [Castellaniella caeni]